MSPYTAYARGAGAAANGAVFAAAAFAQQRVVVPELEKERVRAVHFAHIVRADIARRDGEEAGGLDVTGVGDEHDAFSVARGNGAPRPRGSLSTCLLKGHRR